jgi:uncharacterized cupredoxin-like copper-binding protein
MDVATESGRVRMRHLRVASVVAFVVAGAVWASASAYVPTHTMEVVLTVEHSRFSVTELHVERGQRVRFVVRNNDPIDHELIVGPMDVQDAHEKGTEAHHALRDGEVSVPLFEEASTAFSFDRKGVYYFGCHLPGHWDYGMRGRVVVG